MTRTSINWGCAMLAMAVCAGAAKGQVTVTPPASLPSGEVTVVYSGATFTATDGTSGATCCTWSASGLPNGLTLTSTPNTTTATITGTPTLAGTFSSVTVTATDNMSGSFTTSAQTITVVAAPTITPTALPNGTVGASYGSQVLSGTGGTPPYTLSGPATPAPGLTFTGGATGTVSGTPTTAGTFAFNLTVTDSLNGTTTQGFSVTIAAPPLTVTTTSLPSGEASAPYAGTTLAATGGTPPYTWSVSSGALPANLSLTPSTGAISGTLAASAITVSGLVFKVTDSASLTASSSPLTLTVTPGPTFTTTSPLPQGEAGHAYSETLVASLGSGSGYKFTGTPPAGLTLSSAGVISGTPTTAVSSASFSVTVTDSASGTATKSFTITIVAALAITTTSLPNGDLNLAYSQTLAATGGAAPLTWSIASGLPPGLTVSSGGVISGAPTTAGTYPFTAKVTDSLSATATQSLSITINAAITITPASLPQAEDGAAYSQTLTASGGSGTGFNWALASGSSLPTGLTLSAAGVIAGTPTVSGPFDFSVQVTDSLGGTATQAFSLNITPGPTITTAPTLPNGTVGVSYATVTLTATGGTTPYTWSITSGALPAGLNFNGTAGTISGMPSQSGTFNFTVQVSDAKSVTGTKPFSITVAAGLTIVTAPALPNGTLGQPYTLALSAAGGSGSYTWAITSGALPGGMTFSAAGVISGTPSAAGNFTFTVQVTDSNSVTATKVFTLTVVSTLSISSSSTLPAGVVGVGYSQALTAAGGTPPYVWTVISGTLPAGLSLTSTGVVNGTPSGAGTFTFTATVADSAGHQVSQAFSLTITSGLAITSPAQLPNGSVNSAYSQTLSASGGTPPYRWVVSSGTLPPGLALSPGGVLAGTPTTNGTFKFTAQVTDNTGATATQTFSVNIGSGLTITSSATLASGTLEQPYATLVLAAGGRQPYTWSLTSGALPPGLSLSSSTGAISGTPNTAGSFTFTLQVTDSNGATATLAFTISIVAPAPPTVNISGLPATSSSAQQINFGVALASSYPLEITGTVTVTFAPDAVAPADDPAIQLSTGGRTANFDFPPNTTTAVFSTSQIALQTGTVSGTITLTFTFQASGTAMPTLTRTVTIPRAAPVISAVKLVTGSNSFQVEVTGYSPPRELTEADLTFTPASGASLQTTSAIIDLSTVGPQWFQGSTSAQYGSQFILVMPFTATQGSISAVASVSVTLKNSTGASPSASASF